MRRSGLFAVFALFAALLAGCGGSSSSSSSETDGGTQSASSQPPAHFPSAAGKTFQSLRKGLAKGPILAPSTTNSLERGRVNRFGFALFNADRSQLQGAQAAVYTAAADGTHLQGPYVAKAESLKVSPRFESQTTASDPDAAKAVYVAKVPLTGRKTIIFGLAQVNGKMVSVGGLELTPATPDNPRLPPDVGQPVPRIHTPTLTSAHGNAKAIDTRVPAATDLLRDDLYDVLGKKPVVLTFATPQLCQSRVCGPVVDVVDQVKSEVGDKASFIHVEIYNDNDANKGFRPQVKAFRLPTEPWTFVIDRSGRVSTRFDGAFSVDELRAAVGKVT